MTTVPELAPHTQAVSDLLTAAEVLHGIGVKPAGGGWQGTPEQSPFHWYAVVHPLEGTTDGPVADPDADVVRRVQVTVVGITSDQAERGADRVRAALVGARPTVAGRSTEPVGIDQLSQVRPDDTAGPRVFITTDVFTVASTPA